MLRAGAPFDLIILKLLLEKAECNFDKSHLSIEFAKSYFSSFALTLRQSLIQVMLSFKIDLIVKHPDMDFNSVAIVKSSYNINSIIA
jgi:hypothetical protein